MDPHSRATKKNASHGNEVLPQNITHFIQRPRYQQAIGPHGDLTIAKTRKLKWYGYVSPLSGVAKTILQGTLKGGRRHGRKQKRWEDNISEWTDLEFSKSQTALENKRKNVGNWLRSCLWCSNDHPRVKKLEFRKISWQ